MKLARKLVFHIGCGYLDAISLVVRYESYNQMLWMTGSEKEGGVPFQT